MSSEPVSLTDFLLDTIALPDYVTRSDHVAHWRRCNKHEDPDSLVYKSCWRAMRLRVLWDRCKGMGHTDSVCVSVQESHRAAHSEELDTSDFEGKW